MVNRKSSPVPAVLCDLNTVDGAATFENPFDILTSYEAVQAWIGRARPCGRNAAYRVNRRNACRDHLVTLVDAQAPDWADNMVAVELLAVPAVTR